MVANLEKFMKEANKTYRQVSRETKIPQDRLWDLIHSDSSRATDDESKILLSCLGFESFDVQMDKEEEEKNEMVVPEKYDRIFRFYMSLPIEMTTNTHQPDDTRRIFTKNFATFIVKKSGMNQMAFCDVFSEISKDCLGNWINSRYAIRRSNFIKMLNIADKLDIDSRALWMASIRKLSVKKDEIAEEVDIPESTVRPSIYEKPATDDKLYKMLSRLQPDGKETALKDICAAMTATDDPAFIAIREQIEKSFWELI